MKHGFEDDTLVQRIRGSNENAAWKVQTEQDIVRLLEQRLHLIDENERLQKLVEFIDMKQQIDELKARVAYLEGERN